MDWTAQCVIDCVWSRLGSWEGAFRWSGDESPLSMIVCVRSVCTATRRACDLGAVFSSVGRPYLARSNGWHARRALVCEAAARTFVRTVDATRCAIVAGGFAAWQLERAQSTREGRDGYMRAVRGTTIAPRGEVSAPGALWIPESVDVFYWATTDTAATAVRTTIECAFAVMCRTLTGTCVVRHRAAGDANDDAFDDACAAVLEVGVPASQSAVVREVLAAASDARGFDALARERWTLTAALREPFFPSTAHLVRTTPPPDARVLAWWVTRHFDMVHCRVVVHATAEGAYAFECDDDAARALERRQIVVRSRARDARVTAWRVRKYLSNGFAM